MIRPVLRACLVLVLAGAAAAAERIPAERIPADCTWAAQVDAQALLASRLGGWLSARLDQQPHAARLAMLEAVSGLALRRDLRRVTVCGVGERQEDGLLLVRGTFDAAKLATLAQAAEGHRLEQAEGRTIHVWNGKDRPAVGCLAQPDLLILGASVERVRTMLRVLDGPASVAPPVAPPPGWDGALAWVAATGIDALAAARGSSAMLASVRGGAIRLVEADGAVVLEARLDTAGEAVAQQLAEAGRGLLALLALQRPGNIDGEVLAALLAARIERSGSDLGLRVAVPLATALQALDRTRAP